MDAKSDLICFACRSGLNPSRSTLATHQKLPEGQRTFLLLELLGFPKNAESMISETRLCRPCYVLVKKGLELKNEIQKLEERLEKEVRSVILEKFRNGVKEGQKPSSLSKSKLEPPQKKFKTSENERISFPFKNELNSTQSSVEGLIDPEDIKEEVDLSLEPDTEQTSERLHSISDSPVENDYQCDLADEDYHTEEINFGEPEKEEETKNLKRSKKRKHFLTLGQASDSDADDDSDPDWEVTFKVDLEKQLRQEQKILKCSRTKQANFLALKRGDSSNPSVSDPPKKDSDVNLGGMSETVEDNEFMEEMHVPLEKNAPIPDVKRRTPKPTHYKYDCPSPLCPKIKDYSYNDFAQHLRFHKRRPYRCKLCCEFVLDDPNCWKEHLERSHPEVGETPVEEIIIKDDIKSVNVFQCWAVHKCVGFPTEAERDEHERTCESFKRKRRTTQWHQNQMTCTICQKQFRNENEWRLHRVLEHPEEDWMRCPFCEESFQEKTLQGVEERNDVKLFDHIGKLHRSANDVGKQLKFYDNCESCGLLFKVSMETAEHFRDKHGFKDWTWPCRICGKKSRNATHLRRHMYLVHFRPEGIVCDLCGVKFNVQNTLIEHKFSQHQINEDNLPRISCPERDCEFSCFFKETLRSHCEQHQPKNKICEICGKGFKRGPDLNRHRFTHSTSLTN